MFCVCVCVCVFGVHSIVEYNEICFIQDGYVWVLVIGVGVRGVLTFKVCECVLSLTFKVCGCVFIQRLVVYWG